MSLLPNFMRSAGRDWARRFRPPHGFDGTEAALAARFPDQLSNIRALLMQVRRTLRVAEFTDPQHSAWWRARHAAELPLGFSGAA